MNTQLQRMMVVLFLVLTIVAVVLLFWLPVNNDSDRILVAKEGPSNNLLNLSDQKDDSTQGSLSLGTDGSDTGLLGTDGLDLLADDSELRRKDELAEALPISSERKDLPDSGIDESGKSGISPASSVAATTQQVPSSDDYAYDVMGNKRPHVSDYTVRKNDWFSTVAGKYWDDLFMWPDLYTMNTGNLKSSNPDLIFPGEKISIYESLTADGVFSEEDRLTLLSAYLKVYKIYKQLGERKDLAAAQLLASAVRYDKDFLDKYSNVIAAKDKQMAQRLIKEQKFLD